MSLRTQLLVGCASLSLLLGFPVFAQTPQGDLSGFGTTSVDGTTPQTLGFSARKDLTVENFGAKGDCTTDDSAAFNAYTAFLRAQTGYLPDQVFRLGAGKCYSIQNPVNLAGFDPLAHTLNAAWTNYGGALTFEGQGSVIAASNLAGKAVFDAAESVIAFRNFQIISSSSTAGTASRVGIQVGRATTGGAGASPVTCDNVLVDGYYLLAAMYVRSAESATFVGCRAYNRYAGVGSGVANASYAFVADGVAKFPFVSSFYTDQMTYPAATSFQGFKWIGGEIQNLGTGPAIWMSGYSGHAYFKPYVHVSASVPLVDIWAENSVNAQDHLFFDVHGETAPTATFLITGNATAPVFRGFTYIDEINEATASIFKADTGVTGVTLHDFSLHIGILLNAISVFDVASGKYAVDGMFYVPSGWNLTSGYTGLSNSGGALSLGLGGGAPTPNNPLFVGASGSVNDVVMPIQINTASVANQSRYYGANFNGTYGVLFGYDNGQLTTGGQIREVDGGTLSLLVSSSVIAMQLAPTTGAATFNNFVSASAFKVGVTAGVSCAAASVVLSTLVVTNGIVTHC